MELIQGKLYRLLIPRATLHVGAIFVFLGMRKETAVTAQPYYIISFLYGETKNEFTIYRDLKEALEPVNEELE